MGVTPGTCSGTVLTSISEDSDTVLDTITFILLSLRSKIFALLWVTGEGNNVMVVFREVNVSYCLLDKEDGLLIGTLEPMIGAFGLLTITAGLLTLTLGLLIKTFGLLNGTLELLIDNVEVFNGNLELLT